MLPRALHNPVKPGSLRWIANGAWPGQNFTMEDATRRICELQPLYSSKNTPEMQEKGILIRRPPKSFEDKADDKTEDRRDVTLTQKRGLQARIANQELRPLPASELP